MLFLAVSKFNTIKIRLTNNQLPFLELVRVGLWANAESPVLRNHGFWESVDWEKVYQLAEEQSVVGLVVAGIEHLKKDSPNLNVP